MPLGVPSTVEITRTGAARFVVSNHATGRHFAADARTVGLIEALRRGTPPPGLDTAAAGELTGRLRAAGIVVAEGETMAPPRPRPPVEGRLVSARFDLVDGAGLARRLEPLGRALLGWPGLIASIAALLGAAALVAGHWDKAMAVLAATPAMGAGSWALGLAVLLAVKAAHEAGHATAYRVMCRREGLDPGPIRLGVALFALAPFPFTDVSGAWRLRSRWRRAAIGLAGVLAEGWVLAGLAAFWALTGTGPLQEAVLRVALLSGILTVAFNLNPLVKLDGYYVACDLLDRPNTAPRASRAARDLAARALGGRAPAPDRWDLAYWGASYVYRWTIFAGVFWLAWGIDPRLGVPVGAVALSLLLLRPAAATAAHVRKVGARPGRVVAAGGLAALAAAAALVPLPHRIAMDGRLSLSATRLLHAPEPARVASVSGGLRLESPELAARLADVAARRAILEAAALRVPESGVERAGLAADLRGLVEAEAALRARLASLDARAGPGERVDPLLARRLLGAWTAPGGEALAAATAPSPPVARLWLDGAAIEAGLLAAPGAEVVLRPRHAPGCRFEAATRAALPDAPARGEAFAVLAAPTAPLPDCAAALPDGTALRGHVRGARKTPLARLRIAASRMLQDRLPIPTDPT